MQEMGWDKNFPTELKRIFIYDGMMHWSETNITLVRNSAGWNQLILKKGVDMKQNISAKLTIECSSGLPDILNQVAKSFVVSTPIVDQQDKILL